MSFEIPNYSSLSYSPYVSLAGTSTATTANTGSSIMSGLYSGGVTTSNIMPNTSTNNSIMSTILSLMNILLQQSQQSDTSEQKAKYDDDAEGRYLFAELDDDGEVKKDDDGNAIIDLTRSKKVAKENGFKEMSVKEFNALIQEKHDNGEATTYITDNEIGDDGDDDSVETKDMLVSGQVADADGNGKIDVEEYIAFQHFVDENQDGVLTDEEKKEASKTSYSDALERVREIDIFSQYQENKV